MNKRAEISQHQGVTTEHPPGENEGDLTLNTLSEFTRVILIGNVGPEATEKMIDEGRKEMGMCDLPTGDIDAIEMFYGVNEWSFDE